jgi:hypothetical protein
MRKSVIAIAAIGVLVLAAGAGAASRWVITSIHQIKPSVLNQLHGQNGARGPQGPQGPQGAAGTTGAAGSVAKVDTISSGQITIPPGETSYDVDPNNFQANCPTGETVVGTAFNSGLATVQFVLSYSYFVGGFFDNQSSIAAQVYVEAICAPAPIGQQAFAAHRATRQAAYQADLKAAQAALK